jgi:hypothetical protein
MRLEKATPSAVRRATYFFGGLKAPAASDAPLMAEFTLRLQEADVANIGVDEYTGVAFGFLTGTTGVAVKFFTVGGTRRIEVHDAGLISSMVYSALFDWDQTEEHTYKLLWYPKADLFRLYVSSGQDLVSDVLLVDGAVSAFSSVPAEAQRAGSPWAYFGHEGVAPTSVSYWRRAHFYNLVLNPIVGGIHRGGHTGILRTNDVVYYVAARRPEDESQPWSPVPESYGTIAGAQYLAPRYLEITKTQSDGSFGYYRVEPRAVTLPLILDFTVSGELRELPSGTAATGMEIYVDDGTNAARVGLLDIEGTQYLGLLATGPEDEAASYSAVQQSWVGATSYRVIFEPGVGATLSRLVPVEEGYDEETITTVLAADLPASSLPGPGVGFLHNALAISALATMRIHRIRYMPNVRLLSGDALPPAPWAIDTAGGIPTSLGGILTLDSIEGDTLRYHRPESELTPNNGVSLEMRGRVEAYEVSGVSSPSLQHTGVGFSIDDGTYLTKLLFADAGDVGKIVILVPDTDVTELLRDIQSGVPGTEGFYAVVDWTRYHLYRLEKTVGGSLRLFVDEAETPIIEQNSATFSYPASEGSGARVSFGNYMDDRAATSNWKFLRHSVSEGFDLEAKPLLTQEEVLQRFGQALNVIVEAEDA